MNISTWHLTAAENQDMVDFTLIRGNERTQYTHRMTLEDIQNLISNTSVVLLKNGIIVYERAGIEYFLHFLLDPDFDILSTDYPELKLLSAQAW